MSSVSRPLVCLTVLAVIIFLLSPLALADIPKVISYQGKVTDSGGNTVTDGNYQMRFRIVDAPAGGTVLWDSGFQTVSVNGGVFNVVLGESPQPAMDLDFSGDYWLLVTFDGANQIPRQRLTSAGYAYMASGLVPGTEVIGSVSGSALKGTNTSTAGVTHGLSGTNASTSGMGVYGVASATTGATYGVYGTTFSPNGSGVFGVSLATSGTSTGVYGWSFSTAGRGIYGLTHLTTGTSFGVYGQSNSTSGVGVYGLVTADTGEAIAVYGESSSTDGTGVLGEATATEGWTYGVYGRTSSTWGRAVFGEATASTGQTHGGRFETSSVDGRAVHGEATATTGDTWGVIGLSVSPLGTGVGGEGGLAGGDFGATSSRAYAKVATISYKIYGNGSVAFVQNHPNNSDRVIVYSAPEGDEVATYTRGRARLRNGSASVAFGETFKWVTNPDIGLTAHVTPREECNGLYVASLSTEGMVVRELGGGISSAAFDYVAYGLRIGFEEVSIVQEKREESYIPSMHGHHDLYTRFPELRKYNALERFKTMHAAVEELETLDLSGAAALRDAIVQHDPVIHRKSESNAGDENHMLSD